MVYNSYSITSNTTTFFPSYTGVLTPKKGKFNTNRGENKSNTHNFKKYYIWNLQYDNYTLLSEGTSRLRHKFVSKTPTSYFGMLVGDYSFGFCCLNRYPWIFFFTKITWYFTVSPHHGQVIGESISNGSMGYFCLKPEWFIAWL